MLTARNITKSYGALQVLKGVDIDIFEGEIVCIVGSSGAGKSTLLHILGTLDTPDSGAIFLNNAALHRLKNKKLADFRNHHMGFVFQFHHLLPEFTALENVCIPSWIAGNSKKQTEEKAAAKKTRRAGGAKKKAEEATEKAAEEKAADTATEEKAAE